MTEQLKAFLLKYGMIEPDFDLMALAHCMCDEMKRGLLGEESSYPMIPTYLSVEGKIADGEPVAVIDAGGTNFRSALVHFENGRCVEEHLKKCGMPGVEKPVTWQEFITFVADQVEELMPYTDRIGFCFSYSAEITPNIDGRVLCIDKEVVVTGCEGQLVGASLSRELSDRGWPGKRVVVLNDTAAVQLGGMAKHMNDPYRISFGQVSGTGTNTCLAIRGDMLGKLGSNVYDMIVNMESGMFHSLPQGYFDQELDRASHNPGQKRLEKMTAGVYLGELCHLMLRRAAEDGLLSEHCTQAVLDLPYVESWEADAWATGENMERLSPDDKDAALISGFARFLFQRSAELMCANLIGMVLLTDAGKNGTEAICAEGSLIQRNHIYKPELNRLLELYLREQLGRDIIHLAEEDTTLPGAAVAALLNC